MSKKLVFLYDLKLGSEAQKPNGRIEQNFIETVRDKLEQIAEYARKHQAKVICFGRTFNTGFCYEGLSLFLEFASKVDVTIVVRRSGSMCENLSFLTSYHNVPVLTAEELSNSVFDLVSEKDSEVKPVKLSYYRNMSLSSSKSMEIDASVINILLVDSYFPDVVQGIDYVLCCAWRSVTKPTAIRGMCSTIIRRNKSDSAPVFATWSVDDGFNAISLRSQEYVYDDLGETKLLHSEVTRRKKVVLDKGVSQFALAVKADAFSGIDFSSEAVMQAYFERVDINDVVKADIQALYASVTG
ncbi:hypothetical protein AB4254_11355 [Vibrio breoganii]